MAVRSCRQPGAGLGQPTPQKAGLQRAAPDRSGVRLNTQQRWAPGHPAGPGPVQGLLGCSARRAHLQCLRPLSRPFQSMRFGRQLMGSVLGGRVGAREVQVARNERQRLEAAGSAWAGLLPDKISVLEFHPGPGTALMCTPTPIRLLGTRDSAAWMKLGITIDRLRPYRSMQITKAQAH